MEIITATPSGIPAQVLTPSDWIQIAIAIATFLAVIVTFLAVIVALFAERLWRKKDRPKIDVYFDSKDPECYHLTNMHIVQDGRIIESIPTYYIRLKVSNSGVATMENTEVVLESVEPKPERFMSLNLSWAGFNLPPNDIKREVRIPHKQSRIVDVIEVMEPSQTEALANRLSSANDTDADRYKAYSKGFRSCSIKPNTLSDIFPAGKYILHIGVYADNTEPKTIRLSVNYDGSWGTEGIEGMRSKHLKVRLLD